MIDIHAFVKAIKASWLVKINNAKNSEWNFISKHMIRFCTIKNMFLHMNFKCCNLPCLVILDLTDFYKQVPFLQVEVKLLRNHLFKMKFSGE